MKSFNPSKIDWCDKVWNPVIGCSRNPSCPYCYARKINNRFHPGNDFSNPKWVESAFEKKSPKKGIVFVNSMSDFEQWIPSWQLKVYTKVLINPQCMFLTLSKDPPGSLINPPKNLWRGMTMTAGFIMPNKIIDFISYEPILESLQFTEYSHNPKWIIMGLLTGTKQNYYYVKKAKEWAYELTKECDKRNIPVFHKNSLRGMVPGFRQDYSEYFKQFMKTYKEA